jgi:hypothetical protein
MIDEKRSWHIVWLMLALVSLANYGNFYVYDSIGPVADLLQQQRGFSDSQIGMLNAIYSLPNIVQLLIGGTTRPSRTLSRAPQPVSARQRALIAAFILRMLPRTSASALLSP